MTHHEIRKKFLDFFKKQGHKIVPSSSLIPDDPSVLFTTAGMQQFKKYYLGQSDAMKELGSLNAASSQKSMRTSDIERVGDESHLTFFEMLGNFSFGGYWKEEAINLAYEFITEVLKRDIEYVSVFIGDNKIPRDEESERIWKNLGFESGSQIKFYGRDANFWGPTGNEGPCGPTTEIYMKSDKGPVVEVWNIVFNEYYCLPDGNLVNIEKSGGVRGVDTGMGLERLAMILQNVSNIFETDLFKIPFGPLLSRTGGVEIKSNRIIADHLRASTFLLADGVEPSNKGRGYILRRLIRKLMVHAKRLFIPVNVLESFITNLINEYSLFYPELKSSPVHLLDNFIEEVEIFNKTLEKGLKEFNKRFPGMVAQRIIPGQEIKPFIIGQKIGREAFDFFQTYGFPIELIKELLEEKLYTFDLEDFSKGFKEAIKEEEKKHKEISRVSQEKKFKK